MLISPTSIRDERRAVNEAALDTAAPLHRLATPMSEAIAEEARTLAAAALTAQRLASADFERTWWRVVRRVVLGRDAAD
ncbi:MAG: cytochrome P450, partial [Actinomycetota bacterium]|nr:cytochrome P450 [Actinomycetota bacterium]